MIDIDQDEEQSNNCIKVILVGDTGTGKTNLISVAAGRKFKAVNLITTTCSFFPLKINIDGKEYQINLWDTIGQEKYQSITKIFFKHSKIVLYVYDITNRKSFDNLKNWKQIIDETLGEVPIIGVVGNKCDLFLQEEIKEKEGKNYADEIGAKLLYTSAKLDAKNFREFVEGLAKDYVIKYGIKSNNDIKLNKKKHAEKNEQKDKKCCKS